MVFPQKPDQPGNVIHTLVIRNEDNRMVKRKFLFIDKSRRGAQKNMTVGEEEVKVIYRDLMCLVPKETVAYPLNRMENQ